MNRRAKRHKTQDKENKNDPQKKYIPHFLAQAPSQSLSFWSFTCPFFPKFHDSRHNDPQKVLFQTQCPLRDTI